MPLSVAGSTSRFLEECTGSARAGPGITIHGYASLEIPGERERYGPAIAIGSLFIYIMLEEVQMHIGSLILVIWLVIGGFAAAQRGDYKESVNCSGAATTAVTILAGPLNYIGANPHINCTAPNPSN